MNKTLLLFSGGPDSTAAAYLLRNDPGELQLLSLSDELKAKNIGELVAAKRIAAKLGLQHVVVDISPLNGLLEGLPSVLISLGTGGEKKTDFVKGEEGAPLSSQLLHTLGALHGIAHGFSSMIWGVHADDERLAGDGWIEEYVHRFNSLLAHSGFTFHLATPYLHMTKAELMHEGYKVGAPIEQTFSCISPGAEVACGRCAGCKERNTALSAMEVLRKSAVA